VAHSQSNSWCGDPGEVRRLADFFVRNVTHSYISHSELQFGRARSISQWASHLSEILCAELIERIPVEPGATKRAAYALVQGNLAAIALVTFNSEAPIPFIIVEDIVVESSMRGCGIGQNLLDWIFSHAKHEGISRAFLESGEANDQAHRFFAQNGFKKVSIVMMAELASRSDDYSPA
jgi:GNAT superfamily N-acetyltransferase